MTLVSDESKWCGHKLGVYSFAHCPSHRVLLSAGYDNKIMIWDPLRIDGTKPVLPLSALKKPSGGAGGNALSAEWRPPPAPSSTKPHRHDLTSTHSHIVDIAVNEDNNQIITACSDKKINVYDIRMLRCIYETMDTTDHGAARSRAAGSAGAGPGAGSSNGLGTDSNSNSAPLPGLPLRDELSAMVFDEFQHRLVTAGTDLRVWPVVVAPGNRTQEGVSSSLYDPVVATCYSTAFQWIVTVTMVCAQASEGWVTRISRA